MECNLIHHVRNMLSMKRIAVFHSIDMNNNYFEVLYCKVKHTCTLVSHTMFTVSCMCIVMYCSSVQMVEIFE